MTKKPSRSPVSIRAKLLNLSKVRKEDFQLILSRYAAERFLFRLGQSEHRKKFVLKGAMLLYLWGESVYRPTRDLDFAGYGQQESIPDAIKDIAAIEANDGIVFDLGTFETEIIRNAMEYRGMRIKFKARLEKALIPMQIDVGIGDSIVPSSIEMRFPTLLDDEAPEIKTYPKEVVIAEKFHAIVFLDRANSRMKDFYDLFILSSQFEFSGETLSLAIRSTFSNRKTDVPSSLDSFMDFFSDSDKKIMWSAYLKKSDLKSAPKDFSFVGRQLRSFLEPVSSAVASGRILKAQWPIGGPWSTDGSSLKT